MTFSLYGERKRGEGERERKRERKEREKERETERVTWTTGGQYVFPECPGCQGLHNEERVVDAALEQALGGSERSPDPATLVIGIGMVNCYFCGAHDVLVKNDMKWAVHFTMITW
jgi:hypothetical protein